VYRSDRVSHGGGVTIYVNKKLKAKIICQHTINSAIEYIFLEIQNPIMEINLLNEECDQCLWNNIYSLPTVDRQLNLLQLNISD